MSAASTDGDEDDRMNPTPERLVCRTVSLTFEESRYEVSIAAWDPDASPEEEPTIHTFLVRDSHGGFAMDPDDHLGDCMEMMSSANIDELVSPRLRRMWLTGALADEVMGTLAQSGLLKVMHVDEDD
jgi:hypothetical protein